MSPLQKSLNFIAHNERMVELPPAYSIDGGTLYLCGGTEKFWQLIEMSFDEEWETLYLGPGETISREMVQEYAQLSLEIPPAELIKFKQEFSIKDLKGLVAAKLPPLIAATFLGSVPLMEKVFGEGKDLNFTFTNRETSFNNHSPLTIAFFRKKFEAFQWLLEKGGSLDALSSFKAPLELGFKYPEWKPYAELLIKHGFLQHQADSFFFGITSSLHRAAKMGDIPFFKFLLEIGAPLDFVETTEHSSLFLAVENKHEEMTDYLLSLQLKVDAKTLKKAIQNNDAKIITLLLQHGAELTWEMLTHASKNPLMNQLLLQYAGNLPNEIVFEKLKWLFLSNKTDKKFFENLLVQQNFNINMRDSSGTPFLHMVLKAQQLSLLKAALSHSNVDKKICDAHGVPLLHLAVCNGEIESVRLLLQNGFEVNEPLSTKITPLHIAADRCDEKMVALLLEHNADSAAKDAFENPAFYYVLQHLGYTENLIKMLKPKDNEYVISPNQICLLHDQGRLPFVKEFYEKLEDKFKWQVKEENMRILCAHAFELSGDSELTLMQGEKKSNSITLEGMFSDRWLHRKLNKQLQNLKKDPSFPLSTLEMLSDACQFSELGASKSDAEFLQRFHEGKPIVVRTGYYRHAVQIVFWKTNDNEAVFAVNNRNDPVRLFRMQPSVLTEEMIGDIRRCKTQPSSRYETVISDLISLSNSDKGLNEIIERYYPLQIQKIGNCTYASFEAALWTLIMLLARKEEKDLATTNELFSCLLFDLKLTFTAQYFDSHIQTENPYFPDMTLVHKLFEQLGPYQAHLADQYKELAVNFTTIPWKESNITESSVSEKELTYKLLRETYYK